MKHKSPNLSVASPRCRCCGRYWRPPSGVSSTKAFCQKCADERRAEAKSKLGLRKPESSDFSGGYLLPRWLRSA